MSLSQEEFWHKVIKLVALRVPHSKACAIVKDVRKLLRECGKEVEEIVEHDGAEKISEALLIMNGLSPESEKIEDCLSKENLMEKPSNVGWYWVWFANQRDPHLYWIDKDGGFSDHNRIGSVTENWAYIKQQLKPVRCEFLGYRFPERITPTESGYYWVTCKDGTRHIVRCNLRRHSDITPVPVREWDAEIIGSAYTHSWTSIVNAYQVVRIDFITVADADFNRSKLSS